MVAAWLEESSGIIHCVAHDAHLGGLYGVVRFGVAGYLLGRDSRRVLSPDSAVVTYSAEEDKILLLACAEESVKDAAAMLVASGVNGYTADEILMGEAGKEIMQMNDAAEKPSDLAEYFSLTIHDA